MQDRKEKHLTQIYNTIASKGGYPYSRAEFGEIMADRDNAKYIYNTHKQLTGENLIGAPDENSFLDSLGMRSKKDLLQDAIKQNATPEVASNTTTTDAPSFGLPTAEDNLKTPKDSVLPQGSSRVVSAAPVKSADEVIAEYTPAERVIDESKMLGEDTINDALITESLAASTEDRLAQWHKDNDAFIAEYEKRMNATSSTPHNVYTEGFNPMQIFANRQSNDDRKFINANSAKYNELIRQRDAIQRTKETVDTMKQYAEWDRHVGVEKELSSLVDKGELTDFDMKTLTKVSDEKEKVEELTNMYNQGRISEDTFNKIMDLGDTSDKSGLWYGMFKTGKLEDFATLGLNELARNMDIVEVAERLNKGLPVNEDEMTLLHVYNALSQMKNKERSFGFNAGMGVQQSMQFVLESLLTGGVNAIGGSIAKQGGKAFLKKLGQNAVRQATLTPITPGMYNDFTERLTGMYLSQDDVTGKDKAKELYKSYVVTFAERFSETLGNVVGEYQLFNKLVNNKFTRKILGNAFDTMSKIADSPLYKTTSELLAAGGISDIPGEFASEYSGNIINSIFTLDAEPLAELFNPEFFGQVALQSVMMGGMGKVASFTVGGGAAALESRKTNKEFKKEMNNLSQAHFDNPTLETLKGVLTAALDNGDFVGESGTLEDGAISGLFSQMKAEYANTTASEADKQAMAAVDNAIRSGVFKYGQDQAVMAVVESNVGEFLHDDGYVHEATDNQGKSYFILAETPGGAITALDRATGEKVSLRGDYFENGSINTTKGSDWAMQQFIDNIDVWNAAENKSTPTSQSEFKPADRIMVGTRTFDVAGYNPNTGKYTVLNENGEPTEIDPNDEDVTPLYSIPREPVSAPETETPPVNEENPPVETESPQGGSEVEQTEKVTEKENNQPTTDSEIEYGEDGDPVWSKISAERAKQEIDSAFDEDEAKGFVADKIKAAQKAVEKADKKKPKATNLRDRKTELEQIKAEREQAKANLEYWNAVSQLYVPVQAETPATKPPVVETPTEGQDSVPPVVDNVRDTPADARARGFRSVEGVRYDRQQPMQTENLGSEVEVKFADGVSVKGKRAVIEASTAQPSHVNGTENPLFFLNEGQPKDRTDKVSIARREKIAQNIRPEEITGGVTAYTGSPVVNTRGEAIQGNGRIDALRAMYQSYPEQAAIYKQYLIDHAAEFGYDPQVIASMEAPILVDMLDVTDEQAIQLGQRTAQDIESGGEQKISAQNVAQSLGKDMKSLANILLKTEDEDADINDVISENGYEALKWLTAKKVITETQLQTALNEKGDLTVEAREALKDVLSQIIFQGGNNNIRKQFAKLPKAAQKAILQTIARELDSVEDNGILSDIQEAIEVYSSLMNDPDFRKAKTSEDLMAAALSWAKQIQMDFTEGNFVPEDRYSNFAIALAVTFKANTMKQQSAMLNQLYDYIQAEGGDIFNPAVKLSKAEAVKQVYGVELKEKQNEKGRSGLLEANDGESSTGGQTGSTDVGVSGQTKQDVGQTNDSGTSGTSNSGISAATEQIDVDTLKAEQVSAETAKAAIDSQKGVDAVAFVESKVAQSEKALNYANKLASMASTEADVARVEGMIAEAQKDLNFWSDVLNLYNQSNENANGTSGQSNTEVSQETPNSGTETANQTGQTEQENPQGAGNKSDNRGVNPDEGHSRLGDLKTEIQQKGLRRQGVELENAYDNVLGAGSKLWKTWADRYNTSSYALLMQLKQAQKEARENNGWVSDATFRKVYARIYQHAGSDIVLNAMKGNTGPSSKTLIPKDSILGKRGIESGVHYGLDALVSLYNDYNIKDEEIDALAEKVFSVAKNLGIGVIFSSKKFGKGTAGYSVNTNTISLNTKYFNSDDFYKERKGDLKKIALHETIHAVTSYALEKKNAHKLTPEIKQAVDELNAVYNALEKDRKFFTFYGSKNVKEMVAEMANPQFREYLKSRGMFKRIIGAISKFFVSSENQNTNAFTEINNALNKLLDSFNEELYNEYNGISNIDTSEDIIEESVVTDAKLISELESSPKKTGYRNVVLNLDGTFGSPMASGLRSKGKDKVRTTSFEIGKWEQAEENPQLANEEGKITLVKPDGKSVADVDYNPYIHNRLDTVNAQFKQAWERPNLVYIETEVATTDLESGYKAEKAAKPVGVHKWNNGDLMLSRYDKPIRIVPWSEVADDWVERFKDRGVEFDIVPPALLPILTMRGVNILPPHKGMGKACNDAYAEWQENPLKKKEGIISDEQIEQLNKQYGVNSQENQEQIAQADTKENVGRTAEQKQALFDKAKEIFGTTNNFKVAGYMLPDGSLLDFSGRWEGGPGDARYTDHRAIGSGLYEASETDSNYDTNMYDFTNQGAIRLMPESAGIYVSQPLTEKQEDRLASYIYRNNGEVILEIIDNDGNSISYIEYNRRTSPEKVLSDINNYFEKGIKPVQPEVRYRKKKASDTALPGETPFKGTVISNADEANILKNLDTLAKKYENKSTKNARTFIGDLAKEIGATTKGSDSKYATFMAVNGTEFTIRLADHNATVSNFDNNSEDEGISIVISRKENEGITNNGKAHIVEYFYNDKKLRNADGYPLVEIIKSVKQSLYSGQYKDNTGLAEVEEVNEKIYRQSIAPYVARIDSEEVMQESIDKMAQDLGVNAEYVSDENQLDKKGWYDPAAGKVYVNLAAHETIDDAKATYLHEVVGHFGLRGLLKDKFEKVMNDVFDSLPKDVQDRLFDEYKDKTIAAEEYLASMIENDIEPSLVEKILGFIREAIRSIGINLDHYTNGDLEYLLWRSKNNLRENAGHVEAAQWGAKNKEARYRSVGRPAGYKTNTIEMTNKDKMLHAIQDRMRPVKKLMNEIINRNGVIGGDSDPYTQEFLATSRAAAEIEDFKNQRYEPLAKAMADAMKVFTEQMGMTADEARKAVDDYLYARHAPERNKRICVNEIVEAGMNDIPMDKRHLVDDAFEAELNRMAEELYDNQFKGGKNVITPQGLSADQLKLAMATVGAMQKKTTAISKETAKDERTGHTVTIANNRSGMSDAEAEFIINKFYTAQTKAALDEVSARVKDCTNFTLEKWLEYGLINQEEYDAYQNQYEYYIPLRGWEEKAEDIDYTTIPSKAFNVASEIVSLNRHAEGRTSKAENPLAYIASLAQSACISGNRNLIRQQAFNMVAQNQGLIDDLAVIEDTYEIYDEDGEVIGQTNVVPSKALFAQGRVKVIRDKDYRWHKTPQQLKAHQVGVMINGVRHVVTFKGGLGTLVATSINGTYNDTRNAVTQGVARATRFVSSNLTAKNVYFLGKNLVRDLGFGNFAYFVEHGFGKTAKLNKYFVQAMRTAAMDAMGADKSTYKDSALYEEFKLNGGQTGYVQMENIDKLGKEMEKLIKDASKNRGYISQQAVDAKDILFKSFDVLGKASENAMRFAIYKLEREAGSSPREAAIRAKEITVNFNRQGTKTKGFSAVYAFFNPAIQGAYRFAQLAKQNTGRFVTATVALMAIKFGLGLICEMFSGNGDEPEGEKPYDRLSDYVKATNWVIPLGWLPGEGNNDKFLLIPMPQSVRGPVHIADLAVDMVYGKKDFGEAVKDFAMFNIGEFIPFDMDAIDLSSDNPAGTVMQAASPTVIRPFVEIAINRDFMGNPIFKEPYTKQQNHTPQHQMAFNSTSPLLVGASKFLNEVAGGSENRSAGIKMAQNEQVVESQLGSFMDINPAKVEHILSGYFGGMFKPVLDVYDTMTSAADKDVETDISSVALVNQFIKGPSSKPGYKKYYQMRDEVELMESLKAANKKDGVSNDSIDNNEFNKEITNLYEDASEAIKMATDAISETDDEDIIKKAEEFRDFVILEAANRYREICKKRDNVE